MSHHAPQEIEIKLRVADIAAIRRRLRSLGARSGPRLHEINALFDTADQFLRRRRVILRLRVERRPARFAASSNPEARRSRVHRWLFPAHGAQTAIITVKAPRAQISRRGAADPGAHAHPAYKIRREIEFQVPDSEIFRELLSVLGFRPSFYYEKIRTTFRLPGLRHLLVSLDETPIGIFLELEGHPAAIDRARSALGYRPQDAILLGYGGLYLSYCAARGQRAADMLF